MNILLALCLVCGVNIALIGMSHRWCPRWLLAWVITDLFLANIFGSQFVEVGPWSINIGNIFYAFVFLTTQCYLESHVRKNTKPFEPLWIGLVFMAAFLLLSQAVTTLTADSFSFASLFSHQPSELQASFFRVTMASLLAYFFAQYFHVTWYQKLKERWNGRSAVFRSFLVNGAAQIIDTAIFFTFAFTDISASVLLHAFVIGWTVKMFVVVLGSPLLYVKPSSSRT